MIKYSIIILLYSFSIDINMRKNCVRIIIKCKRYITILQLSLKIDQK